MVRVPVDIITQMFIVKERHKKTKKTKTKNWREKNDICIILEYNKPRVTSSAC